MPTTFTHFYPLGYLLTIMLGAGRDGVGRTARCGRARDGQERAESPADTAIAFVGMMGNLTADATLVILVPLAGILFAAAGRHPLTGIAACFASVGGGISANLLPAQLDALLFGTF